MITFWWVVKDWLMWEEGNTWLTGCIQDKQLAIKCKEIQKILEIKHRKTRMCNHPVIQSSKRESLKIHHSFLTIFQVTVITFSSNAPHYAHWNHFPQCFSSMPTKSPLPTVQDLYYALGMTQASPKRPKIDFYIRNKTLLKGAIQLHNKFTRNTPV